MATNERFDVTGRRMSMRTLLTVTLLVAGLVAGCAGGGASSAAPTSIDPTVSVRPSPFDASAPATPGPTAAVQPWIAYQRWAPGETTQLGLVRPDGSEDHQLPIEGTPSDDLTHPDWSPDGRRIAFDVFFADPDASIGSRVEPWVAGIEGGTATRLASCTLPCLQIAYPTWSPDGTRLAVIRYDVAESGGWGPNALEIIDAATGERRVVAATADGLESWYFPRWSPDGRTIVLVTETYTDAAQGTHTGMALATVAVDGDGALTRITPPGVFPREVDWSWVTDTFVASVIPTMTSEMTEAELVTMRPDGSGMTPLTSLGDGDPFVYQGSWDPSGERVIFTTRGASGRPALGFVGADGRGLEVMPLAVAPRTHGRIQPFP
jgi:Tol biopolymer transport system component